MERADSIADQMGGRFDRTLDSVYMGGGTPTILDITELERLFVTISQNFELLPNAEVTIECAPGTLTPTVVEALKRSGVNRVSLGAQSFVDQEAAAVGRLHSRNIVLADIARLRAAGISNINIDLIAGLPHQTSKSWEVSIAETISSGVPHVSVYMLEVDEDSRLGRELIAGGTRYHAHFVPQDEATADFYEMACVQLDSAGVRQYEISNFARQGFESRHNLKYWTRQPYLGFGVDAHSMLLSREAENEAVRFSTPDSLEEYVAERPLKRTPITSHAALEETFFLGLRLNRGVDLKEVAAKFEASAVAHFAGTISEFVEGGLMEREDSWIRLTPRGRLLSNEVFERFVSVGTEEVASG
jgi:oxygen-independent coproporphyrinogen-3 oxidase